MVGITSTFTSVYHSNATSCLCKLEVGSWILDLGASDHMSFDPNTLHDLSLLEHPVLVSLPNGHKVQVTHHGKLNIGDVLELNHVLLVPHFKYNLLSVKRLAATVALPSDFHRKLMYIAGPFSEEVSGSW